MAYALFLSALKVLSTNFIVFAPEKESLFISLNALSRGKNRGFSSQPERQKAQEKGHPLEVSI